MSRSALSVDDLQALNREILELTRAGIPLELGLEEFGRDQSGVLRETVASLADRMRGGMSLPDALEAEGNRLPRLYRTIVEAGLEAQHLPAALETVATYTADMLDLRRRLIMALVYPLGVVCLAYLMFLGFLLVVTRIYADVYQQTGLEPSSILAALFTLRETLLSWFWLPPLIGTVCFVRWLRRSRGRLFDFESVRPTGRSRRPSRLTRIGDVVQAHRCAGFLQLLSVLIRQQYPLGDAIRLAADAAGDPEMRRESRALAIAAVSGDSAALESNEAQHGFPAFARWLLATAQIHKDLAGSLERAAETYRQRARQQADLLRFLYPLLAGVGIGGTVTFLYALVLFSPFWDVLHNLSSIP